MIAWGGGFNEKDRAFVNTVKFIWAQKDIDFPIRIFVIGIALANWNDIWEEHQAHREQHGTGWTPALIRGGKDGG